MMLVFAGIDGMAWLHEGRNSGEVFMQWVDRFMPKLASGVVTSRDFWSTRNALLHEQSSSSDLTRSGKAKPFLYATSDGRYAFPLVTYVEPQRQPVVVLADSIVDAFEKAVGKFRSFIETSERRYAILSRCDELFYHNLR